MVTAPTLHARTHVHTHLATRPISRSLDAATAMTAPCPPDLVRILRCMVPQRPGSQDYARPLAPWQTHALFLLEGLDKPKIPHPFCVADDTVHAGSAKQSIVLFFLSPRALDMHMAFRVRTFPAVLTATYILTPRNKFNSSGHTSPEGGKPLGSSSASAKDLNQTNIF
jgi:hypothetical protein